MFCVPSQACSVCDLFITTWGVPDLLFGGGMNDPGSSAGGGCCSFLCLISPACLQLLIYQMRESSFRQAVITSANPEHLNQGSHGTPAVFHAFQALGFLGSEPPLLGTAPRRRWAYLEPFWLIIACVTLVLLVCMFSAVFSSTFSFS